MLHSNNKKNRNWSIISKQKEVTRFKERNNSCCSHLIEEARPEDFMPDQRRFYMKRSSDRENSEKQIDKNVINWD